MKASIHNVRLTGRVTVTLIFNLEKDAWIIINGIVANITEWIPKHPGGMVIMKGVGKDATQLFKNIGHSNYALKMLKKYQIGILAK
jgi:cytochrome b involved in lipid metabolism